MYTASRLTRFWRIANTAPEPELENSRACPAPPGYCRLAASLPLAGPAAASQGRKPRSGGATAPALTGWSWSGAFKLAARSLLSLKKLCEKLLKSLESVTVHGCDASEAKAAISKVSSRFALILKDKLSVATAGHVQERLILRRKNNHIERDRRRFFYLAFTDGRPSVCPTFVISPCTPTLALCMAASWSHTKSRARRIRSPHGVTTELAFQVPEARKGRAAGSLVIVRVGDIQSRADQCPCPNHHFFVRVDDVFLGSRIGLKIVIMPRTLCVITDGFIPQHRRQFPASASHSRCC